MILMNKNNALQQGFTLIEVLVAMVIMAVAVPALMQSISTQTSHLVYVKEKSMAQWVATNQFITMDLTRLITGKLPIGKDSGEVEMAGQNWSWESNTKEFSEQPMKSIYAVKIDVFLSDNTDSGDDPSPLVTHYGFLYDPSSAKGDNLVDKYCSLKAKPSWC